MWNIKLDPYRQIEYSSYAAAGTLTDQEIPKQTRPCVLTSDVSIRAMSSNPTRQKFLDGQNMAC